MRKFFLKNKFFTNIMTLFKGTSVALLIPILISPILTRIYTPEDFGFFAIFVALVSILSTFANAAYDSAVLLPKNDKIAFNIFALAFIINLIFTIFLGLASFAFNKEIGSILKAESISFWFYFVPVSVFFIGIFNLLNMYNTRKTKYKDIANSVILKSVTLATVQLTLGFLKKGVLGLVSGQIISYFLANSKLLKNVLSEKKFFSSIKLKIVKLVAIRYQKFPKYVLGSSLLNTASTQLPVMLLTSIFSPTIAGFFAFSQRVTNVPISALGSAVGQVFYQKVAYEKNNREKIRRLSLSVCKNMFNLGIVPFALLLVFGDYMFEFVFGENWKIAGQFSQHLSLWIFSVFIFSPLTNILMVFELQQKQFAFDLLLLIFRTLIILSGYFFAISADTTVFLFGLVSFIMWLGMGLFIFRVIKIQFFKEFKYNILLFLILLVALEALRVFYEN